MTTTLEQRYRRLLRLLPVGYRRQWEEEMVSAFMESMTIDDPERTEFLADNRRPSWSEVLSVVSLAVRLRFGGIGAAPRYVTFGEAARLVALIGLLVNGVLAVAAVTYEFSTAGHIWVIAGGELVPWSPWRTGILLSGLLWFAAYLAVVLAYYRAARVLATLALLPELIDLIAGAMPGHAPSLQDPVALLFEGLLVLSLWAFRLETPPVRALPWLLALPVGVAVIFPVIMLNWPIRPIGTMLLLDGPRLWSLVVVIAGVVSLLNRRTTTSWTVALMVLAAGTLASRLATLPDYVTLGSLFGRELVSVSQIEVPAVFVTGLLLGIRGIRALRRLDSLGEQRHRLTP